MTHSQTLQNLADLQRLIEEGLAGLETATPYAELRAKLWEEGEAMLSQKTTSEPVR